MAALRGHRRHVRGLPRLRHPGHRRQREPLQRVDGVPTSTRRRWWPPSDSSSVWRSPLRGSPWSKGGGSCCSATPNPSSPARCGRDGPGTVGVRCRNSTSSRCPWWRASSATSSAGASCWVATTCRAEGWVSPWPRWPSPPGSGSPWPASPITRLSSRRVSDGWSSVCDPDRARSVIDEAGLAGVPITQLGVATDDRLSVKDLLDVRLPDAIARWRSVLPDALGSGTSQG